jgi:cytosine/adenosine deaminase-related metal-dependent hydrolase
MYTAVAQGTQIKILDYGAMVKRFRMLAAIASLALSASICVGQSQDGILSGAIVTPDRVIQPGWLVIKNGHIDAILDKAPPVGSGRIIETGGTIFPGFVDLHNHPMYNIFPRWPNKTKFKNRYEWRDLQEYKDIIGTPGSELQQKNDQTFCDIDEYAEVRAVIGGTTSITGITARRPPATPVPACVAGLVRNLDWSSGFYDAPFGKERIENALGITPHDMTPSDAQRFADDLSTKRIDLLLVHAGEGSPDDIESTLELIALKGRGLLGDHTAVIHGTGFSSDDFRQMRVAGTALIWSPRGDMTLYRTTTNVAAALREGVTIALAPDWSPTGSVNMLSELGFASRFSKDNLMGLLSDRDLFKMATSIPARIARIDDKVGSLQPGLLADFFVLKSNSSNPFAALAQAEPGDVQLVVIGGVPVYGSQKLMGQFAVPTEAITFCGKTMLLNSADLPAGKFDLVKHRLEGDLAAYKLSLAPIDEDCAQAPTR